MIIAIDIQNNWPTLIPIFILMLITFILGYGLATYFHIKSTKTALKKQKSEIESLHNISSIKDIDLVFTEIKPKITELVNDVINNNASKEIAPLEKSNVAEKAKSTYVSYSKQEPKLDLTFVGRGTPSNPDDLTKIEGIGPYVQERLNTIGIYNFEQISKLQVNDIRAITELIDFFPGRIERDTWIKQSKSLLSYRSQL
jgi:predicted flap endonuclease-1-like 5' DNA nuclease